MKLKIKKYINDNNMIQVKNHIVVGVSGGADSVCLLFVLHQLQKEMDLTIWVVHVNHGIRGLDAEDDCNFVEKLCSTYGCHFTKEVIDVKKIAKNNHISEEEAGRMARYEAFHKEVSKINDSGVEISNIKIAVAHHIDDQAETLLFRLARGTGLPGLCGMRPVSGNLIRPLLNITKQEIYQFLHDKKLEYREDATNKEDHYTRNRIRNQILPGLEESVSSQAAIHIANTAFMLADAEDYIATQASIIFKEVATLQGSCILFNKETFIKQPKIIQNYLILHAFHLLSPGRKDISRIHVQAVLQLFIRQVGKTLNLPGDIYAIAEYTCVKMKIGKEITEDFNQDKEEISLLITDLLEGENEKQVIFGKDSLLKIKLMDMEDFISSRGTSIQSELIPEKTYTKWFDYDKILGSLSLRFTKEGDFLIFNKEMAKKTLKEYMKQEKIPREMRGKTFVLADGNHILWVIGGRISQYYKINETTKRILQIEVTGGITNG